MQMKTSSASALHLVASRVLQRRCCSPIPLKRCYRCLTSSGGATVLDAPVQHDAVRKGFWADRFQWRDSRSKKVTNTAEVAIWTEYSSTSLGFYGDAKPAGPRDAGRDSMPFEFDARGVSERVASNQGTILGGEDHKSRAWTHVPVYEPTVVLDLMECQGCYVSEGMLYGVLKECSVKKDLSGGRRIHAVTVRNGYESNVFLANHLIRMYSSHGRLVEARQVFRKLPSPNTHVWASIIAAHTENGQAEEGIHLYWELRETSSVKANDYVFVAALKACASIGDLESGRQVHADIMDTEHSCNVFVGNSLVDMYAKSGSLNDAHAVFDRLPAKNVVTWTALMSGYSHQGLGQKALDLFVSMEKGGMTLANAVTFVCLLKACSTIGAIHEGKQLHRKIKEQGLETDLVVGNALVDMYAKCGELVDARGVFDKMPRRDVVSWNTMIAGYLQQGFGQEALNLYSVMAKDGVIAPNDVTFVSLLKACGSIACLPMGKQLHAEILLRGLEADIAVGSTLVDMYAKCGSLDNACQVFDRLPVKDVVTWTALIAGYGEHGLAHKALKLYARMQANHVTLNKVTFVCLLKACASVGAMLEGKHIHTEVQKQGLDGDVTVGNALIDFYAKCGDLKVARGVFDKLQAKDIVTLNVMLAGYAQHGQGQEALTLYASMDKDGITVADSVTFTSLLKSCACMGSLWQGTRIHAQIQKRGLHADVGVGNALIDMYAKCGSLEDARIIFDMLPAKDLVTWTAMISGYVAHGLGQEALNLYRSMLKEGLSAVDSVLLASLLKGCASIRATHEGKLLHSHIRERGLEADLLLGNALVDMYAKCGSLEDARTVFHRLQVKNAATWTALITGYAQHGLGEEAIKLYASMQQYDLTEPDSVTFVSTLKACGSTGAIRLGREVHAEILKRGLESDVFVGSTLVDMYAKCGSLEEAREVFERLPTKSIVTWNALVSGYGQHNECSKAVQCFQQMQQQGVEPDSATFTCLLVACSHVGLVTEGQQYFKQMREHGIEPSLEHYNCMVDLLGRSGNLAEAENTLRRSPFQHDTVGWKSLLSACKIHKDIKRGRQCFDHLVELEPQQAAGYVLMSNIYADAGMWEDVHKIDTLRRAAGAQKRPAIASIEVDNKVHDFMVGDQRDDTVSKLRSLNLLLEQDVGSMLGSVAGHEEEDALCGHAEKLALAFGLLNTAEGISLRVTKNLRMCNDCHDSTKTLSKIEGREIIVRDAHRVHHFSNGFCSCGDAH